MTSRASAEFRTFCSAVIQAFKRTLIYRSQVVLGIFSSVVQMAATIFVWAAVYAGGSSAGNYTLKTMITYIIMVNFVGMIFTPSNTFRRSRLVKGGDFSVNLLRPLDIDLESLAVFIGGNILNVLILAAAFLGLALTGIAAAPSVSVLAALLFLSNIICMFCFGLLLSNLSFYIIEMWPIMPLYRSLYALMSGGIFPLDLLPNGLRGLFLSSPFSLFGFVNVKVLEGSLSPCEIHRYLALSLIYSLIFFVLHRIILRRGLKKYEGIGV